MKVSVGVSRLLPVFALFLVSGLCRADDSGSAAITAELGKHQFDLRGEGRDFLMREARTASIFGLGELHGEKEIPALLHSLWPELRKEGYGHVAEEVSPWAAHELEWGPVDMPLSLSLWSRADAQFVRETGRTLWGCDIEEGQPNALIRQLFELNPGSSALAQMAATTRDGYNRKNAPELLRLAGAIGSAKDRLIDGESLRGSLLATLGVEALRADGTKRYEASVKREGVMKALFEEQYRRSPAGKVILRFGLNHLHRGYDARGVSTLGNFIAELAASKGLSSFHVGAFAAGGKEHLNGETFDADETGDEVAFRLLAGLARYPATVFDLRPIRPALHAIPADKRPELEKNLTYWADSYDSIICYRDSDATGLTATPAQRTALNYIDTCADQTPFHRKCCDSEQHGYQPCARGE